MHTAGLLLGAFLLAPAAGAVAVHDALSQTGVVTDALLPGAASQGPRDRADADGARGGLRPVQLQSASHEQGSGGAIWMAATLALGVTACAVGIYAWRRA